MKQKVAIFGHDKDADGYTSTAIALRAYPNADVFGWSYGDPVPNVDAYDLVILVDLTIYEQKKGQRNYKWMRDNAHKLLWIDHHVTTIQEVNEPDIPGLRIDKEPDPKDNCGACRLAWKQFFPNERIPLHVELCAAYDVFNKTNSFISWDNAWLYQLYLDTVWPSRKDNDYFVKCVRMAEHLMCESIAQTMQHIEDAKALEIIRAEREREIFSSAETFTFRGHKAYIIHATGRPAGLIRTHQESESCIIFIVTGQLPDGKNKVSIRVSDTCNMDADGLARNYFGGGHEKAAGCKMTDQQLQHLKKMKYDISPAAWLCIIAAVIFLLAGLVASLSPDHTQLHEAMIGTMTFILFPISSFLGIFLMLFGYGSN